MKKVLLFAHADGSKAARGSLEFFSDVALDAFLKNGGVLTIRYEGGDIGLTVKGAPEKKEK